jgi:hypothetical protein
LLIFFDDLSCVILVGVLWGWGFIDFPSFLELFIGVKKLF